MLDRKTLVLNRAWNPVATTTVRRAIVLMSRGAAGAVDPETYELADWTAWIEGDRSSEGTVRGVDFLFPVPDVIILREYGGVPRQTVPYTRRNVYRRDAMRCQYCGAMPGIGALTIDHVIPRSRGGGTSWENCVAACLRCNGRKADRLVSESGMRLLREPFAPTWPGGLDPRVVRSRPVWHRFLPEGRLRALLDEVDDVDVPEQRGRARA